MTSETRDTRERILDAAENVVCHCPEHFTMDRVAGDARVSRATVYRHFGGVDGLREALKEERAGAEALERTEARTRILDAALAEFVQHGVHGASVQAIAEHAGVSPMTVYNHFGDKEGLVAALIKERGPSRLRFGDDRAAPGPARALRGFVGGMLRMAEEQRDMFGLVIAPDPVTRRAFRRVRAVGDDAGTIMEERLAHMSLPDGIDPRVATKCLMGMIMANGVLAPILFGEEVEDREAVADQITRLFLKAIETADVG